MDEKTRQSLMQVFQTALTVGGTLLIASGHADANTVHTWTQEATLAVPAIVGPIWLLANTNGWKVSDLFRRDDAEMIALRERLAALESWQRAIEARRQEVSAGGMNA